MADQKNPSFYMRLTSLLLAATACVTLSTEVYGEIVRFDPQAGETRQYNTLTSTEISVGDSASTDRQNVDAYLEFSVADRSEDTLQLTMKPGRTALEMGLQEMRSSVPGEAPQALIDMQSAGVEMILDRDTGKVESVTSGDLDLGQMVSGVVGEDVPGLLDQTQQPNLPVVIEAEEGWQTSAPLRGVPKVAFTVTRVSDEHVYLTFEGGEAGNRLAGLAVLDRATGWIERQVLTAQMDHEIRGTKLGIRMTTVTIPVVDGEKAFAPQLYFEDASPWYDMTEVILPAQDIPAVGVEHIFTGKGGTLEPHEDNLTVSMAHAMPDSAGAGRIEILRPRLYDIDQIPLQASAHVDYTYTHHWGGEDTGAVSESTIHLTGSGDLTDIVARTATIRAEVAWYPNQSFGFSLTPGADGVARYQQDDVVVTFNPTDQQGVFELAFEGKPKDIMHFSLPDGQEFEGQFRAHPAGPDWLAAEESDLRNQASSRPEAHRVLIRTDRVPDRIDLVVERGTETPQEVREIVFATENAKRLDPSTEPETALLYSGEAPVTDITELVPEGLEGGQLRLPLGDAQLKGCRASLAPDAAQSGTPLGFLPEPAGDSFDVPSALLLQTEDRIRRYFYGLGKRSVTLSCDTRQVWKPSGISLDSVTPWVISTDALEINDAGFDTVGDLLARYRFLDADGHALRLQTRSADADVPNPSTSIRAVLFGDGTVRVAGRPVRIDVAELSGTPVERSFDVTFPVLPGGETQ